MDAERAKQREKEQTSRLQQAVEVGENASSALELLSLLRDQAKEDAQINERLSQCEANDVEQDDTLALMQKTMSDRILPVVDNVARLQRLVLIMMAVGVLGALFFGGLELTRWIRRDTQNESVRTTVIDEQGRVISDTNSATTTEDYQSGSTRQGPATRP